MPNEPLKALNTPNTGDLVGAWGTAAVNPNMQVIGGYLGGVASVSLTNTNVSLSISTGVIGTGSITPGAGPVQSANAVIKFIGTLTGNCVVTFPCPGFWIIKNNCTVGSFYIQARAAGTGNVIGLPPGQPVHIYNDGTDCEFVGLEPVGAFVDLPVTNTPAWVSACTVLPYLPCVAAAIFSSSVYPALAAMLGSTFGGNGISTFGVPDLSNRVRVSLGSRITTAVGGLDGATFGAAGGTAAGPIATSNLPASIPYTDPGHAHTANQPTNNATVNGSPANTNVSATQSSQPTGTATIGITINPGSPNTAFPVVQPTLVFGFTFIKT